jgi:two-component system sensor kinase FixL
VAHELNQPLSAIANYLKGSTRLLAAPVVPRERLNDALEKASEQALRAGQIIRRLRSFVEKGPVERNPEELNRVVIDASNLATIGARVDGIRVEFDLAENLPPVSIDKIQIQQVALNLIRNSIEAMQGSARRQLTISTGRENDEFALVKVSDTGPGLAPEVAANLFQPFMTTKEEGMGIGLSICRSIIESHGGELWATPNEEAGVTFSFRVPLTDKDEADENE